MPDEKVKVLPDEKVKVLPDEKVKVLPDEKVTVWAHQRRCCQGCSSPPNHPGKAWAVLQFLRHTYFVKENPGQRLLPLSSLV